MALKLTLSIALNRQFQDGFRKLCQMPLPHFKESYALAKTLKDFDRELETYRLAHKNAIAKHGVPLYRVKSERETAYLSRLDAINKLDKPLPEKGDDAYAAMKEFGEEVPGEFMVLPRNMDAFTAELNAIKEAEFEVYLDHAVEISLNQAQGTEPLTPFEIEILMANGIITAKA